MNILNIVHSFNPGGVERLIIDISNQLVKQDEKAYVCIISDVYSEDLVSQFDKIVRVFFLKRNAKLRHIRFLQQLNKIIRENHIGVMHVHQGTLMAFYMLVKLTNPRLKIFFTSHDTYIFSDLSKKNQLISKLICRKYIAISDAVKEDIIRNRVRAEKVIRIYNGVNFDRFVPEKRYRDSEVITIVNVARFIPDKKGQDVLIKAAAILMNNKQYKIRVLFAGAPLTEDNDVIENMRILCVDLGIEGLITFMGNINNVPRFLEQADIFVLPSRYEGFGISVVEALAMGVPCVVSDIEGLNEVVNSVELGELFTVGDEQALATKILHVIKHLDVYDPEKIASNAKRRFSIESMASALISVYNS